MPPHDTTLESDPAFRALRSRVDRLEADADHSSDHETRLTRLERLVSALARETDRQRALLESVLDEDDPRLTRAPALDALLADVPERDEMEETAMPADAEPPHPRDSPPDGEQSL